MALENIVAIVGFVYLLFYLSFNIRGSNIWLKGCQVLLVSTGLMFMLLIPASFSLSDFAAQFWVYVMWTLRVYVGYLFLWLIVYAFNKWDIKKRLML